MFTRAARFRARIVVCVVLLGGAMTLGLACGTSSHARTRAAHLRTAGASPISAGGGFACALLPSHRVKCWGWNDGGQLGDGTTKISSGPVPVSGITNATQVSAGGDHTCALLSNHKVECWGGNGAGQLGDGKTKDSSTPVSVVGLH